MKDRRRLAWQWCPVNPTHQPPLNPHGLYPTRYGNFLMLCVHCRRTLGIHLLGSVASPTVCTDRTGNAKGVAPDVRNRP
jgi:hypothetical protein